MHEDTIARRTAEVFVQAQGTTVKPGRVLFAGPVFDAMMSIHLDVKVLEVDGYPRFDIREGAFDDHEALATFGGDVPLADGEVAFESEYARVLLDVRVIDMVPGTP